MAYLGTHGRAIGLFLRVSFTGLLAHDINVEVCQLRAGSIYAVQPRCSIEACLMNIFCLRGRKYSMSHQYDGQQVQTSADELCTSFRACSCLEESERLKLCIHLR